MTPSTRRSSSTSARRAVALAAALALPLAAAGTALADPGNGNGNAYGHDKGPNSAPPAAPAESAPAPAAAPAAQPAKKPAGKPASSPPRGKAKGHAKPAPSSSGAAKPAPATTAPKRHGQPKVTICHATGSATNPYVTITIAEPAVRAHARHQDGRDIIPAPAGGCPGTTTEPAATGTTPPAGTDTGGRPGTAAAVGTAVRALAAPIATLVSGVLGETASSPAATTTTPVEDAVLGETSTLPAEPAAAIAPAIATRESGASPSSLPFTGLQLWLLVVAGLALLLGGVSARRAATRR
jgi:hypothetical protein